MNLKQLIRATFFGSSALLATQAFSDDRWFLGGGIGLVSYGDQTDSLLNDIYTEHQKTGESPYSWSIKQKPGSSSFSVKAGRWFSKNQGFEVGYSNLGKTTADGQSRGSSYAISYALETSTNAMYAAYLGAYQFENQSRFYGKLGVYDSFTTEKIRVYGTDTGITVSNESKSYSNFGLLFGLGYNFPINEKFDMRVNYDYFASAVNAKYIDTGVGQISLEAFYKFNYSF